MGIAREVEPVKLIASLLSRDLAVLEEAKDALTSVFGTIDYESELLPFDHTDYYAAEFGPNLQRVIVTFQPLIDPEDLPQIKHRTNELEWSLTETDGRTVNIDPGYVSMGKLVLASTKNHAHRLYLGRGIYGESTLTFQRGCFRAWPWTYPDYASARYCALFDEIRNRYKAQLRENRG
jgi:hypothetical protein